ncbi:MAG: ATP-binding protein, partial [Cyanobacteriota bacterium]
LNVMGRADNPCCLIGETYNEEISLPLHQAANDRYAICALSVNKLNLCYLFGDYQQAIENARVAQAYLDGATATLLIPLFHFYDSLTRLAVYPDTSISEREHLLTQVSANQEKMQKWSELAPMNYLHKFYLVEAERYRVQGSYSEAIDCYDKAIALAKEHEYINEEALANECAAQFYLAWGKEKIAQVYLTDAYYAYARWGAEAKVEDLEQRYPRLLAPIFNQEKTLHTGESMSQMTKETVTSTSARGSNVLDLATVMKAAQAISGKIHLEQLLSTLMQVLLENAGAVKGALILKEGEELAIASLYSTDKQCQLLSIPVASSPDIPATVINYVERTSQTLVIDDARTQSTFAADPYIIRQQPQSVLCTPIRNQGKLIGILYLENNLTTGAFTPDRLEVLNLLSSQAAISIENARLYTNLEESNRTLETKVAERTQELSQTLSELKATQKELIQSEKMAALGQLVAGVAHEINTPLGAIRSSAGNIAKFLNQTLEQLPALFQSLSSEQGQIFLALLQRSLAQESTFTAKQERQFKRALIRQLEAEEIENADTLADSLVDMRIYNDIDAFLPLLKRPDGTQLLEIAYKLSGVQRGTQTINTATERASKVVFALKTYARYDQSGELIPANLTEGIETVLTLYHNQLKHGVEVIRNYTELPPVLCYPDELNQVWTNIIHNALQAMDNQGKLTIDVTPQDQQAKISITDTGKGIPPEIMVKIFEPFFTTKPAGEGSGLGLDIVQKIIEKHQGKVEVESIPGQTTFTVLLPMNSTAVTREQ